MNVTPLVERALTAWPATRDSDRKLILAVWWLQDNNYESHFKTFFKEKAIMPDTITRCRRKLQEQGKFRASKQVEERRFEKFKEARQAAPVSEVEYIMSIFDN